MKQEAIHRPIINVTAMLMSMGHATAEGHVDLYSLCCGYDDVQVMLLPMAISGPRSMLMAIAYVTTEVHADVGCFCCRLRPCW